MRDETGHNCRDFASNEPVSAAFSDTAVKKGNTPQSDGSNVRLNL
jgi:hypothetical protein